MTTRRNPAHRVKAAFDVGRWASCADGPRPYDSGRRRLAETTKRTPRSLALVVLAAGKGKRLKSATPKVLHPICGRPVL